MWKEIEYKRWKLAIYNIRKGFCYEWRESRLIFVKEEERDQMK